MQRARRRRAGGKAGLTRAAMTTAPSSAPPTSPSTPSPSRSSSATPGRPSSWPSTSTRAACRRNGKPATTSTWPKRTPCAARSAKPSTPSKKPSASHPKKPGSTTSAAPSPATSSSSPGYGPGLNSANSPNASASCRDASARGYRAHPWHSPTNVQREKGRPMRLPGRQIREPGFLTFCEASCVSTYSGGAGCFTKPDRSRRLSTARPAMTPAVAAWASGRERIARRHRAVLSVSPHGFHTVSIALACTRHRLLASEGASCARAIRLVRAQHICGGGIITGQELWVARRVHSWWLLTAAAQIGK